MVVHKDDPNYKKGIKESVPETTKISEGSSSRNIQRKHDHMPNRKVKKQHGGSLGGKGKWNDLDDGSLL